MIPLGQQGLQCGLGSLKITNLLTLVILFIASSSAVKIDGWSGIRFENLKDGQIKDAAVLSPSIHQ